MRRGIGVGRIGERPAARREVDRDALQAVDGEIAGHVVAIGVAGADLGRRLAAHEMDFARAVLRQVLPGVGERELVAAIGDRRRVDDERIRRGRERDIDELRVVQRQRRDRCRRMRILREGPAARDEGERDAARAERPGRPEAVGVATERRRRLPRIELQAAEPRPAQREFGLQVGDRRRVDGVVGRRNREGDVKIVAAVHLAEVDLAPVRRRDDARGRAFDGELARRGVEHRAVAERVAPAGATRAVVGDERDADVRRRELRLVDGVAELGDALAPEQRVEIGLRARRAVAVDVLGRPDLDDRVLGESLRVDRRRDRHGGAVDREAVGERELGAWIEDRGIVDRRPGGRAVDDIDVRPADLAIGDIHIDRGLGAAERRGDLLLRHDDAEGVRARLVGRARGVLPHGQALGAVRARRERARREEVADRALADDHRRGRVDLVRIVTQAERHRALRGDRLQRRIVELGARRRYELHVDVRHKEEIDAFDGARADVLPSVVAVLEGAKRAEDLLAGRGGVGPRFLEPHDLDRARGAGICGEPVAEGAARDEHRRLRVVEMHGGAELVVDAEFRCEVGDGREVQHRAARAVGNHDVDVAAAGERAGADRAAVHRAGKLGVGLAGLRIDHLEGDFLAGLGVAEAHLEAAVDGEQLHLVGDVGEEQHRRLARGDLRKIRIQPGGDAQGAAGEVQLADHQELTVGAQADDDLAVEGLLRGEVRVDLGAAGDQHRRGKGGGEAVLRRVELDRQVLRDDLLLDASEPLLRRERGRQREVGPAQLIGLVDRRQGLEELDARREVVDRQAGRRIDDDAGRQARAQEHAERPELGDGEADTEAAHAGEGEAAFHADEEDALVDRRGGVEVADQRTARVELEDAADERRLEIAAEELALHRHADRGDVDDRELAAREPADVDHHAFDRAGELEAGDALDAGDGDRQRQLEVARIGLDVGPGDADLVDVDRQPARPHEAVAARRADGEEHAEALLGDEGAVAEEGEIAAFAADHQAADLHFGADGAEAHQFLVRRRRSVEVEVARRQREERAEGDAQRVGTEDEALDVAVLKGETGAERFGVRVARPVRDARRDGLAGQELRAAGGDKDLSAEVDRGAEGHAEVGDAQAQIVELQQPGETDLAGAAVGAPRRLLARGRRVAEDQHCFADGEAVHVHREARLVVVLEDVALDAERREVDRQRIQREQCLARRAVVLRRIFLRSARPHFDGKWNRQWIGHPARRAAFRLAVQPERRGSRSGPLSGCPDAHCDDVDAHGFHAGKRRDDRKCRGATKSRVIPLDNESMSPWPGETQLTGKAGAVAALDARLWHAVAENRANADRVAVLVRYAPWWLNLDTLRPGTVDHHDIVEANDGKDSVVPALSREAFENLPETVKPLLRYSVAWGRWNNVPWANRESARAASGWAARLLGGRFRRKPPSASWITPCSGASRCSIRRKPMAEARRANIARINWASMTSVKSRARCIHLKGSSDDGCARLVCLFHLSA